MVVFLYQNVGQHLVKYRHFYAFGQNFKNSLLYIVEKVKVSIQYVFPDLTGS